MRAADRDRLSQADERLFHSIGDRAHERTEEMAATTKRDASIRWRHEFANALTFGEQLAGIGLHVGPRKGPDRRTEGQREDWCLRYLLAAWDVRGLLQFPMVVEGRKGDCIDFVVRRPDGSKLGVEVIEATPEKLQRHLTDLEAGKLGEVALDPEPGGYVPEAVIRNAVKLVLQRVAAKSEKLAAYRSEVATVDLVVRLEVDGLWREDFPSVVSALRASSQMKRIGFDAVNILREPFLALDVGSGQPPVDLSPHRAIDFTA